MAEFEAGGDLLLFPAQSQQAATPQVAVADASADMSLVEAAREGDHEAFGRLYRRFAPMVHGILIARVPYGEVADLVQDVFLVAFKKLHTLRDSAAFGPWLAMITRNRAMDFHRHSHPTEELPEDLARYGSREAEALEVLAVIRHLPDAYRETLILRLMEGLTGPEIAEQLGLTHSSVRVNLHRGMKMLRQRLGMERCV